MRRALQMLAGLMVILAGWRMWRLLARWRANTYENGSSQSLSPYSANVAPQPAFSASATLPGISGMAGHHTPAPASAVADPAQAPRAPASSPASTSVPPSDNAANPTGAPTRDANEALPADDAPARTDDRLGDTQSQMSAQLASI